MAVVQDLDKLIKELQTLQTAKARLEGEQKQLLKALNDLGFASVADAEEELERLDEYIRREGESIANDYATFRSDYEMALRDF